MDKSLTLQPPAAKAAKFSRTWQGYLDEMAHMREQMQRGRREIEMMQTSNTAAIDEIKALLSRLGSH